VPTLTTDRPALLVIFGAGASWDSIPGNANSGPAVWRPPLAKQLFEIHREYAEIAQRWDCVPLVAHLRQVAAEDKPIEDELGRLQAQAGKDPRLFRQLAGLRCYLQDLLWMSSTEWLGGSYGDTNYVRLGDRIESWRFRANAEVAYVTFNYDLLLDAALASTCIRGLPRIGESGQIESYVSDPDSKLFKVHGSVNWVRGVANNPTGYTHVAGDTRRLSIEHADKLDITDQFRVVRNPQDSTEEGPYTLMFPAIAVPTRQKSVFECPPRHVDEFRAILPRVRWLLVIGWRGQEEHFIAALGDDLRKQKVMAHIVSHSVDGAKGTNGSLLRATLGGDGIDATLFPGGFSQYVARRGDEQLLPPSS
jgi:hypothetical protein